MFTDWLARNRVDGYIGEVGWPDDRRGEAAEWNQLAERWYQDADAARLWVTNWAAGEWWKSTYDLASYEDRELGSGVDSANTQAAVIEAHPSTAAYRRGVNVAGGAFGAPSVDPTSTFSNANPGRIEVNYHYDAAGTFSFLRAGTSTWRASSSAGSASSRRSGDRSIPPSWPAFARWSSGPPSGPRRDPGHAQLRRLLPLRRDARHP